jgi:hypothetical protein
MFNVIDMESGWKVDFILRKSRVFSREEFNRRRRVVLHGISICIASVEDVIVAKLEWARSAQSSRQIEDVAAILKIRFGELDLGYVEKWIDDLDLSQQWVEAKSLAE